MLPAFLITFREVIEASLIVVTILGILVKLGQTKSIKTVWQASGLAALVSILLLGISSLFGFKIQELYSGKTEGMIEGILMVLSALFITWAVFFLHKYFSDFKSRLLSKIKNTVEKEEQKGLFILVFIAVFREGFEIVLFLLTIYFSSNPQNIFTGFMGGLLLGILVPLILYRATLRMPISLAFKFTNILLILFAGGLLVRGIHEFAEVGLLPEIGLSTIFLIPDQASFVGQLLQSVFGITRQMDIIQIGTYFTYIIFMSWYVFFKKQNIEKYS